MDYQKAVYLVKTSDRAHNTTKRAADKCIRTILGNTFIGDYEELDTALIEMRQYVSTSVLPLIDICIAKDKVERIVNDAKTFGNYDLCDQILKELQKTIDNGSKISSKRDRTNVAMIQTSILAVHNIFRRFYDYQRAIELQGGKLLTLYPTEVDFTKFLHDAIGTWEYYYPLGQLWFTLTPRIMNGETALLGQLNITYTDEDTGEKKTLKLGGPVTFRAAGKVPDWVTPDQPLRVRVASDPHDVKEHTTGVICPTIWVHRVGGFCLNGVFVSAIPHNSRE